MKKRQKKKLYKRLTGRNPPKWMYYQGRKYHMAIHKPWGGEKEYQRSLELARLENFNRLMTKRRRQNRCRRCFKIR